MVGVSAVANKMHNWGQRARAEVAAHGPLVHYSQEDLSGSREDKIVAGLRLLNERLSAHMLWSEEVQSCARALVLNEPHDMTGLAQSAVSR